MSESSSTEQVRVRSPSGMAKPQPQPPADEPTVVQLQRARDARWKRLLADRTEAMQALEYRLAQVKRRQEQQAGAYLIEIERLRSQVAELSRRFSTLGHSPSRRERHHGRYAGYPDHALTDTLTAGTGTLDLVRELIMDAPIFTRINYQPSFKLNSEGKYQLADFLELHDRSFVHAAYAAILRREPDPGGAVHYLEAVRSGESKVRLLLQIMQSDEARQYRTVIDGLHHHARVTRLCELPVIGRMVQAALFLAHVGDHLRDLRVLENHVVRIAEESQSLHEANMNKLRSLSR